jgi:hypothetical protein
VRLRLAAAATLLAALALVPAAHAATGELRVVQVNVGNSNIPACNDQVFKLCLRPVERRGAASLQALKPDLVSFQEILPPAICAQAPSTNPATCARRRSTRRRRSPGCSARATSSAATSASAGTAWRRGAVA